MGKLVRLNREGRSIPAHSPLSGEGEVVIFTGVRYERMIIEPPRQKPRNPKRKRKRG